MSKASAGVAHEATTANAMKIRRKARIYLNSTFGADSTAGFSAAETSHCGILSK